MKKEFSGIMLILLLTGMLTLTFVFQRVEGLEPPMTEWSRTYGGVGDDQARSAVQTSDGGYALAGFTTSLGSGGMDVWLVKTDSSGIMEWSQTYGGTNDDNAGCLVQTADGGYAMAGYTKSYGAGGRDFWLVKTDSSGIMEWSQTYGGTNDDEVHWGLLQTADEGYIMAGTTHSFGAGSGDFWLVKTDSSGIMEWDQTYGGTGYEMAVSVISTSDGGYLIAGFPFGPSGGIDAWLVKTDSSGNHEWDQTYGGASLDEAFSVVETVGGGYAIAGHTRSFGASRWDWLLLRTDSSGNLLWQEIYGGAYDDYAHSIRQTGDGGYVIAGVTQVSSVGSSFDGRFVKTDGNGQMQWDLAFGEPDERDSLVSIIETADGGYALPGSKGGPTAAGGGDFDFWLIKLAPVEIPATIDIDPDTLNLKSNGEWITAYIALPSAYNVEDIILETVCLDGIPALWSEIQNGVYMAKFDRATMQAYLTNEPDYDSAPNFSDIPLTVTGQLADGTPFEGSDTIRVLQK